MWRHYDLITNNLPNQYLLRWISWTLNEHQFKFISKLSFCFLIKITSSNKASIFSLMIYYFFSVYSIYSMDFLLSWSAAQGLVDIDKSFSIENLYLNEQVRTNVYLYILSFIETTWCVWFSLLSFFLIFFCDPSFLTLCTWQGFKREDLLSPNF